jgi:hypothetical protein
MLSMVFVLGCTSAANLFAQAPAGGATSAEQMRENAATIPEDVRNRMTNECNSKFAHSGQQPNVKRGFMTDCMAEAIKNSRQSGETAPPAK